MKQTIVAIFEKYYNIKTVIFVMFFIFVQTKILHFVFPGTTNFFTEFLLNYLYFFAFGLIILTQYKAFLRAKEFLVIFLFFSWFALLCFRNYNFNMDMALTILFFSFVAFLIPFLLNEGNKQKFTIYLVLFTNLVLVCLGVLGIYSFLINQNIATSAINMPPIYLLGSRVSIFWHPNFTAAIYSISFIVNLISFSYFKNRAMNILTWIVSIIFYIVITLAQSRTANIAFSISVGCIIAYVFLKKRYGDLSKKILRSLVVILLIAIVLFFVFEVALQAFGLVRTGLSKYDFSSYPLVLKETSDKLNNLNIYNGAGIDYIEVGRDYSDVFSFNGRTEIWADYLQIIKEYPSTLLFGYRVSPVDLYEQSKYLAGEHIYGTTHSGYLYILLAFGIPGLVIYLVFFSFLIFRIFQFVTKLTETNVNMAIFCSVIVCFLITEMLESFITQIYHLYPIIVFYSAGMICSSLIWSKMKLSKLK